MTGHSLRGSTDSFRKIKRWHRWAVRARFTRGDELVRVKLVRGHTFKLFAKQLAGSLRASPAILSKTMETAESGPPVFVDFDVIRIDG